MLISKAVPLLALFLSCGWICFCVLTIILSLDWKPHKVSYLVDSSHPHPLNAPAQPWQTRGKQSPCRWRPMNPRRGRSERTRMLPASLASPALLPTDKNLKGAAGASESCEQWPSEPQMRNHPYPCKTLETELIIPFNKVHYFLRFHLCQILSLSVSLTVFAYVYVSLSLVSCIVSLSFCVHLSPCLCVFLLEWMK